MERERHGVRRASRAFLCIAISLAPAISGQETAGRYGETIEVSIINVDVTVTDRAGKPIAGLKRDDFRLFVDGKPTEISHFAAVEGGRFAIEGGASENTKTFEDQGSQTSPRKLIWAVMVDQSQIRPALRTQALSELQNLLGRVMGSADIGLLGSFDGRAFKVRGGLIPKKAAFLSAMRDLQRERVNSALGTIETINLSREIRFSTADQGKLLAQSVQRLIDLQVATTRNRTAAINTFLDVIGTIDARVALVYVGAGFDTIPALGVTNEWRRHFPNLAEQTWAPRPEELQPLLQQEVDRVADRLSASRITFYTIHTGDTSSALPDITDGQFAGGIGAMSRDHHQLHQMGLTRGIAEATGGQLLKASAALDAQLNVISDDMASYYSLAYVATAPAGRQQKLRVEVAVPGAAVRYRRTARVRTQDEESAGAVVAALFDPSQPNPLAVSIVTDAPKREKGNKQLVVQLRLQIPVENLTLLRNNGRYRGGVSLYFAMASEDGTVWRLDAREVPLEIRDVDLDAMRARSITYSVDVPSVQKGLRLSVTVQDAVGGTRSVLTVALPR